ncbi:unnamed protein product [Cuscuta campestris]|uniref:Uncharacterized protein n=1 Tax=Cuscuta campestris TaxID=132261 RepID=A0A484LU85_9ASTE|nr:unnamed protein product [Cuscuta campestris]
MSPEKRSGCGLLNAVFGRRSIWPRRSTSTGSLQMQNPNNVPRVPSTPNSPKTYYWDGPDIAQKQSSPADRIIARPGPNHSQNQTPPKVSSQNQTPPVHQQIHANSKRTPNVGNEKYNSSRKVPQGATGISGELENMILDNQRSAAGNVMSFGSLGNVRQTGSSNNGEEERQPGKYGVKGNLVNKQERRDEEGGVAEKKPAAAAASLCRAISTRMDPEELKILGNEDYKNGRFAEALALYEAAISIDPNKASYRSNKSAALSALGRLLEAVFECREAIRIEPHYQRAHNRLATLYLRLGEAETAMYHYKRAGQEGDPDVMTKARNLQLHLSKCTEAKKQRDWNSLVKESGLAISAGADSAPQIFALKAEALIRLHRYHDADETMKKAPKFSVDECTKFLGPVGNAALLVIQAQVNMAAGRVDEAREAAENAARLDSNNKEASIVAMKMRAVASARSKGNELFKGGRFSEACIAYGDGLDHDPYNAVLLSNRAACWIKLEQYEKAFEDCNAALTFRPSFTKARLRRCDCLFKMGKLEACIQDCEVLVKELPENEEVCSMLKEAKVQLSKLQGNGK